MSSLADVAALLAKNPRFRQWAAEQEVAPAHVVEALPSETLISGTAEVVVDSINRALTELGATVGELKGRRRLRDLGYNPTGIEMIERFMQEHNIADHENGMREFERVHPLAEPVTGGGARAALFAPPPPPSIEPALKKLMAGDDGGYLDDAICVALAEVRR